MGLSCRLVILVLSIGAGFSQVQGQEDIVNPVVTDPDHPGDFPLDPVDTPLDFGYSSYPLTMNNRRGSLYDISRALLYETLTFYGVAHIARSKNYRVRYQGLASKFGYFTDLDDAVVNQAIAEFSRYFNAHLCSMPVAQNFYKAFNQLPRSGNSLLSERLAMRFKNDFAWALLGNSLPREPNQVMLLNSQWNVLKQLAAGTSVLQGDRELRSLVAMVSDLLNLGKTLNKVNCFVDIRPNPREEIKKRTLIRQILEMRRYLDFRYDEYQEIVDRFKEEGQKFLRGRAVGNDMLVVPAADSAPD